MSSLRGKRILVRADGSWEIGLGHVFRARALAMALRDAGCKVAVLTLEDPASLRLFDEVGLDCFAFNLQNYSVVRASAWAEFQPDLVVLDILQADAHDLGSLRESTNAKVVTLDDVGAGLQLADAVINAIVFHWEQYDRRQARARLYEGPAYMILQDEVRRFSALEPTIAATGSRVLVALGGTDTHSLTEKIVLALNQVAMSLEIRVNLGPGSRPSTALEHACEASPHSITLLHGVPSLLSEFWQSDLVVCGGGIMLYELAALGIPAAAIATESHESLNIAYWSRQGTVLSLSAEGGFNPSVAGSQIAGLLESQELRRAMSVAGKAAADGEGIRRILTIFNEILAC